MVSFWPFKGDDNSAEAFEKILGELSGKINRASARNDRFRQTQRRYKALWTLYTTFAYILVAAILTLVTGWEKWSTVEYTAVAGGPVLIFAGRTAVDAYYNYRITSTQSYLDTLNKQRDESIERLKKATKYNSTQLLLDKYGAASPSPPRKGPSNAIKGKRQSDIGPERKASSTPRTGRTSLPLPPTANVAPRGTGIAPPPTANIPRNAPPSPNSPSDARSNNGNPQIPSTPQQVLIASERPGEDFAPNAFFSPNAPSTVQRAAEGPKWYDRIMDVVLGEDETNAKNRIALICQNCRLVNGQAPPGAQTLGDLGKWRCSACHAWNGVESEEKQMLTRMSLRGADEHTRKAPETLSAGIENDQGGDGADLEDDDERTIEGIDHDENPEGVAGVSAPLDFPPAASTRSKASSVKRA